jgi:Iap family predicted aminopeptidase
MGEAPIICKHVGEVTKKKYLYMSTEACLKSKMLEMLRILYVKGENLSIDNTNRKTQTYPSSVFYPLNV